MIRSHFLFLLYVIQFLISSNKMCCFDFAGTYIDKKCPFTGNVSIRGRQISGTCNSAKMIRTIIVRRDYLHFVKKYQRQELLIHKNNNSYSFSFYWMRKLTFL